jgi:hypothetical protein
MMSVQIKIFLKFFIKVIFHFQVEIAILKQLIALWSRGADGLFLSDLHLIQATNKTEKIMEIIKAFRTFMDKDTRDEDKERNAALMVPSEVLDLIGSTKKGAEGQLMSNFDLVNTVVPIEANSTYALMDFVTSNVIQGTLIYHLGFKCLNWP